MRMTRRAYVQKIAAALLSLVLLGSILPAGAVSVASAPLTSQSSSQNGMVRVYLSSLGNPSTLNLTVLGQYSVNGNTSQSLSGGESVTVGFSSATGALTLTRGGIKTNMGTSFALRRHSTSGTSGIRIAQGRKPENPYPGDISFKAIQSGGSYKLYTIAHIYIENYLYGVLPYEMGNGAHIEALKAQAVAARTYTVNMMQSRAGGTYDVVDTTSDQVYNGTPTGNANCVAAVDGTKGIVLMNGSGYTATYYSASNGGQMESIKNAWGTSGYDYLCVKDDPFDLANPDSVVKRTPLSANCAGSSNNASLMSLLKTKAASALGVSSGNVTVQTIKSITPHTPKYASPSRLYTKMDFALTVSAGGGATPVTVTCNIFTELESMLGMSIQSSQNELWSVAKTSSGFTLEARRYGHGLGLSQRGAMYMGKQGYSYDQVLGFYYTGCRRVRISFTNTILAPGGETVTTVEDPADFTDPDTACTAVVKLVNASSSLAIRAERSLSSQILGVIAHNSPVGVYANDGSWCLIKVGGIVGYVPSNALTLAGSAPSTSNESVTQIEGFATVQANGYLNLRASGSTSATILTTAPTGAVLTVLSRSGGWAKVQFGATVAYASADFLVFSSSYPGNAASSGNVTATVELDDPSGTVNLRSAPSTSSSVLAQVPGGATVTVTRDDGSWSTVIYNGQTGYIISSYLRYEGDSLEGGEGGTEPGGPVSGEMTATVSAIAGELYEDGSFEAPLLLTVGMGQSVVVLEKGASWCKVRYEGETGYMPTSQLSFPSGGGSGETAIVATQSGSLNLRKEASAGSTILTTIPKGATVTVTSRGGTWSAVSYNGVSGYVMTSYLQFMSSGTGFGATPDPLGGGSATVTTPSGSLNLRSEARAGSAILRTIPPYATVAVLERGAEWSRVTYAGVTGYAMSVFLTFADEGAVPTTPGEATPDPEADPNDPNDPGVPAAPETPGGVYATVTTASGSLNLRMDPFPGSPVLARVPRGYTLLIDEKLATWSRTTYGGQTGYVMNSYLTFAEGAPAPAGESLTATVTTSSGSLNLRAQASSGAKVLAQIPRGATVGVRQKDDVWTAVRYGSTDGYVMTQFLTFAAGGFDRASLDMNPGDSSTETVPMEPDSQESAPQETNQETMTARVNTVSGSLNLRFAADGGSKVLTTIPSGAEVTVLKYGDVWCHVAYGGVTGYSMTQYLKMTGGAEASQPEPPVETAAEAYTAWVYTSSGALNLRATASSSGQVLTTVPRLAAVEVFGESGGWSNVSYHGTTGYVMSQFLTTSQPAEEPPMVSLSNTESQTEHATAPSGSSSADAGEDDEGGAGANRNEPVLDPTLEAMDRETYAAVSPREDQEMLALWPECTEGGVPLALMLRDERVLVLKQGETWCQVRYLGIKGYCLTEYLYIEEALP